MKETAEGRDLLVPIPEVRKYVPSCDVLEACQRGEEWEQHPWDSAEGVEITVVRKRASAT